jgi:hypothetical protein
VKSGNGFFTLSALTVLPNIKNTNANVNKIESPFLFIEKQLLSFVAKSLYNTYKTLLHSAKMLMYNRAIGS